MHKSARLRVADVRGIVALTQDCRDLGDSQPLWSRRFYAGLAELIGADLGVGGELGGFIVGRPHELSVPTDWGFEQGLNRAGWLRARELIHADPTYSPMLGRYIAGQMVAPGVALRRSDLIRCHEWERSTEYAEVFRVTGVNHAVSCFPPLTGGAGEVFGGIFARATGRPDFAPREVEVVREAVATLTALLGGPLARFAEPSPTDLPPRVAQVLRCLLEGDSAKQIAVRLRLSVHTVNQYLKHIFRHFGVEGRAELMARWVRRGWGAGFAWAD